MTKEEKIKIIDDSIKAIVNKETKSTYSNGGISYSKNLTFLFEVLEEYKEVFFNSNYDYDKKKKIDQECNPDEYSLIDCIVYFNWLWHLEAGMAVGIVQKRIDEGKYLKALERFKSLIKEEV